MKGIIIKLVIAGTSAVKIDADGNSNSTFKGNLLQMKVQYPVDFLHRDEVIDVYEGSNASVKI